MNQVYVGVDLGSSAFQQVAMKTDGLVRVNRDFRTSESVLRLKGRGARASGGRGVDALGHLNHQTAGESSSLFTSTE